MFSLRDLRFAFCSLDLDVLRAQRIIGLFYLNYPQFNEVRKFGHIYFGKRARVRHPTEILRTPSLSQKKQQQQ